MRITLASWLTLRDAVAVDTLARLATSRMAAYPRLQREYLNESIRLRSFPNGGLGHQGWRQSSCNGGNSLVNVYMVELHSAVSRRRL